MNWLILFVISLAISAAGFIRTVYFVSVGYALSIAGMAAAGIIMNLGSIGSTMLAQGIILAVYGIRLGAYLISRESKASYAPEARGVDEMSARLRFARKILIWIGVSILYVGMYSPAFFAVLFGQAVPPLSSILGLAIMAMGLSLESVADLQKSAFKKRRPQDFCDTGVYRFVRCPNYLGEIIFWTGNLIAGLHAFQVWWAWPIALIAYVCIVLIMMGSTKRLETRQALRYGQRQDYADYIQSVPILFPFVPVYTLKNIKVYLE